ncbi:sulfotransferase domain-containing protein [Thiolapillus sp.]|uniref:sulfotransferase domain-containing protein n=6 Tax=Thiolapillus sp. TaxID=2017437 RepID=UPI003AF63DAB
MINGLPKTGTHLAKKIMHLAGMQQHPFTLAAYHADQAVISWNRKYESTLGPAVEIGALQPKPMHDLLLREVLRSIPPLHVFNGHCTHSNALADLLLQEEIQTIALVRDPRDVVVSLAEYLIKHEHPQYRGKSWNKCLRQAIEGYSPIHAPRVRPTEERGWQQAWQAFLPWKEVKGVLFLRFEDLVGPEGGGSEETQLQNIRRILDFAGKQTLPAEEIHGNVFGGTRTIRTSAGAVLAAGKRNSLLKTNPDSRMSSATYLSGWATKPTPTGEISD